MASPPAVRAGSNVMMSAPAPAVEPLVVVFIAYVTTENLVTTDLRSGLDLPTRRYCPMKKRVETRNANTAGRRFDML